jgi:hypothetical protein
LKEHIDFLPAEPAEESERNGKESRRAICGSPGRRRCFNILNHADAASARHLLGEAVNDTHSRWKPYNKLASLPPGDMRNLGKAVLKPREQRNH